MAISSTTIWEFNASATASNVNGGGFNYANANFITDYAATLATTAAPVLTSATYTFVAADVNAWVYVQSGTNWTPGFYKIASVAGGAATLNATIGQALQLVNQAWIPNTVAGIATVASPSGGVVGIDYSRGTAALNTATDLACADGDAAAPTVTSAAKPFGLNHVGNFIHITAGAAYTVLSWFEIVSVSGVTATLDRAVSTDGAKADGTFYLGGAISLAGANDDAVFEVQEPGNISFFKNGTYTLGATVTIAKAGTILPIEYRGYATLRGDNPTGSTRPIIATDSISTGTAKNFYYMQFTGVGDGVVVLQTSSKMVACKITCTSTTADRAALYMQHAGTMAYLCEAISYRGDAIESLSTTSIIGCYAHSSKRGINIGAGATSIEGCLIESNVRAAIEFTAAITAGTTITGCTLYGSENTTGTGVILVTGCTNIRLVNTIVYGFVTGVSHADAQRIGLDSYNCYFNNDTNVTNWTMAPSSIAADPVFDDVDQIVGTAGTVLTGVLTDAAADFTDVVANRDLCYVVSGTGITAGISLITAKTATTITLSPAPANNAVADTVYQITTGRDFGIGGAALISGGYPSSASTSPDYTDIGAMQVQYGEGVDPATAGGLRMGSPGFSL